MLGRILVFIGGMLVVALTAALLVPYFVDWTDFRKDFEAQASRVIGKKVVVHGAVDARLLPFPSITMSDVRVGDDAGGEALITVARFSMDAELAPLLSGQARIYNMHIDRPKLRLKLNSDGTLDWMRTGKPLIPASSVILEQVVVTNGSILFTDEQTGRTRLAENLDARLSARTLAGPWRISGTGQVDGEKASFTFAASTPDETGAVSLKSRILPERYPVMAELDGAIRIVDLKPRYNGRFTLRRQTVNEKSAEDASQTLKPAAGPRISGLFELGNDRVRIPEYELRLGEIADPYVITGEATLDTGRAPEFLLTAEGQQIDMTRFGGTGEGTGAGPSEGGVSLRERAQALLAVIADIPVPDVPGRVKISLPAIVSGDTTMRDIRLDMRPGNQGWLIEQATALLPGRTTIEARGRLDLTDEQSFAGSLLVASSQPSGLAEWMTGGVSPAIRSLKTAGFSADVNLAPDMQRFDNLEIALGPLTLKGRLGRVAAPGSTPSLTVDLTGDGFDLDAMRGLAGLLVGDTSPRALLTHNIAAKLKIGQFSAGGLVAKNLDAAFLIADGNVNIDRLDIADLAGAKIGATAKLTGFPDQPGGEANIGLASADPSEFLTLLATRLPAHPVLDRMAANAAYYADSNLAINIKDGNGDWPIEAHMSGAVNGTTLSARYAAQTLSLEDSGGMMLDVTLQNTNTPLLFGQAGFSTLPFDMGNGGKITVKIEEAPDSEPQASLRFDGEGTVFTAEGQTSLVASHLFEGSYRIALESNDIEPYLAMNGFSLPRMGAGLPLSLTSTVYVTPEAVVFENLGGQSENNNFSSNLNVARGRSPVRIEGDFDLDAIDLGWLAETVYGPIYDNTTGALSAAHLPLPGTVGLESRIALTAGKMTIDSLPDLEHVSATLEHKTGTLKLGNLTGELAKGALTGSLEFGNTAGSALLRAKLDLKDADLSRFVWAPDGKPVAGGRADLALVVEASGKSVASLPESASGSGVLVAKEVTIGGLNQNALPNLLAASDRIDGEISQTAILPAAELNLKDGSFAAGSVSLPFTIATGKVRAANITAENRWAALSGGAEINLPDSRIGASLRLAFAAGEDGLAGGEPAVTLSWQGVLNDPGRTIDPTELTNFLSLRKFETERRRVEILQAGLMEKQRLRREASFYKAREQERASARQRQADQARLRERAEEIIRANAQAEKAERLKRQAERSLVSPEDTVIQGEDLPLVQ